MVSKHFAHVAFLLAATLPGASAAAAPDPPGRCLAVGGVMRGGRDLVRPDAVQAALVAGRWTPPSEDAVAAPGGGASWKPVTANADGWFQDRSLRGGYAYLAVHAETERVLLLKAQGHSMVYVNGAPRAGDPYAYGHLALPVRLRKGRNDLLFACGRGRLKVEWAEPEAAVMLHPAEATLPHAQTGESGPLWGSLLVINARATSVRQARIVVGPAEAAPKGVATATTALPVLPPRSVRKVPFRIMADAPAEPGPIPAQAELYELGAGEPLHRARIPLEAVDPGAAHKRTFISGIDGSVQYYAVLPPRHPIPERPALFLSLHGASVEAIGQARAYSPKRWGYVVAPTNRRPYGFDWEDWGRLDALEVLDIAMQRYGADPSRVYLTGHSMGGHGAWHLGVTYPGRFAAVGPSAGWASFWSYAAREQHAPVSEPEAMLRRAANPSRTEELVDNLQGRGAYILHGADDDNVPVREARAMRDALASVEANVAYHEEPGEGHWWDASPEPGACCVDWAPMFDFFARRRLPASREVRRAQFKTAHPGVSSERRWAAIEAKSASAGYSSIDILFNPARNEFIGAASHVERLRLGLNSTLTSNVFHVELDGRRLEDLERPESARYVWLTRAGDGWTVSFEPPPPSLKGPHRAGPFKDAFRNGFQLVYGTQGAAEENAWAYAKARYDAETFMYRGNGAADVLPDARFDPEAEPDRNVILYGNADTNGAWKDVLDDAVSVTGKGVRFGRYAAPGDGLACLFVRPRNGSDMASVGAVSGTDLAGMRLTDRLPYFVSGVGVPDLVVLGPATLQEGAPGVRAAGFFGSDWSVENGAFALAGD